MEREIWKCLNILGVSRGYVWTVGFVYIIV
jgi:hypothetical protein